MKIRLGFVSNSSSSSFICSVCGNIESGMDMSLSDAGMVECVNEHTLCTAHLSEDELTAEVKRKALLTDEFLSVESRNKIRLMEDEEIEERWAERGGHYYPEEYCPICQFKALDATEALSYLKKKHSYTDDTILLELKTQFKVYEEFHNYLTKK